jgi:O-6-methylguanine DNA methyltransferase
MTDTVTIGRIETPEGAFGAAFTSRGLGRLTFPSEGLAACEAWARRWAPGVSRRESGWQLEELAAQLADYFAGRLRTFEIPLDLRGTPFQLAAWQALTEIGYGQVRTYAEHAAAIGRPRAVRAVGAANGANPVPILVPCHRLIGKGGSLVKYGGGLDVKRRLLELEGALSATAETNR